MVLLRPPTLEDGRAVYGLVRSSPRLDVNSRYAYFLVCNHFADTSVVAEDEGHVFGFLSAYRPPGARDCLFVWQVAVERAFRGRGVARQMLEDILARPSCAGVRFVEATVAPSNRASRAFFERFAEQRAATLCQAPFLDEEAFGEDGHEREILLRIGPLPAQPN